MIFLSIFAIKISKPPFVKEIFYSNFGANFSCFSIRLFFISLIILSSGLDFKVLKAFLILSEVNLLLVFNSLFSTSKAASLGLATIVDSKVLAIALVLATVEAYPTLKATEGFMKLQSQLEGIENNIKNSRKLFNDEINVYNTKVRSFPMNILGGIFGFKAKEGFKADPGAEKKVDVNFDDMNK